MQKEGKTGCVFPEILPDHDRFATPVSVAEDHEASLTPDIAFLVEHP
jgi:hypothetical protein